MIQNSKDYEDNYEDEVIKPLNEYFKWARLNGI